MSILKYIDRAKRMDDLIRRKATGSADEFASKLGVSRSILMENLQDLKELGAPIYYSEAHKSYCYEDGYILFMDKDKTMKKIRGGNSFQENFISPVLPDSGDLHLINISGQK